LEQINNPFKTNPLNLKTMKKLITLHFIFCILLVGFTQNEVITPTIISTANVLDPSFLNDNICIYANAGDASVILNGGEILFDLSNMKSIRSIRKWGGTNESTCSNFQLNIFSAPTSFGPWTPVINVCNSIGAEPYPGSGYEYVFAQTKTARYFKLTVSFLNINEPEYRACEIDFLSQENITSTNSSPLFNGNCTTLTASASGETYLWSTGETTQSINVCNSGTYTCQVTNTSFTGNQDHIASIAVSTLGEQDNWVGPNGEVYAIHQQGNTVYYGGDFSAVGPVTGNGAQIDEASASANTTIPRVNGKINVSIPDGAGGWYIGGSFTRVGNYSTVSNLAHIKSDASVDLTFAPIPNGEVNTLILYGSSLYVGGAFTTIKSLANNYVAKLDKNTGDPLFWNANCNNVVRTMQLFQDQLIIGGDFSTLGGQARSYLGAVDTTFVQANAWIPNPNAAVYKVFVNGSKVYVGGDFTSIAGVSKSRGAGFSLPAFTTDGYDFGANGRIHDFAFHNNVLYTAGTFTTIGGATRNYLAGLNHLNAVANSFNANADGIVRAITVLNGNIIVGGDFSTIGGTARSRIASLNPTTAVANTWNPNVIGLKGTTYNVLTLATQGTNIYAGGNFWSVGASVRNNIAAVDAISGSLLPIDINANNIVRSIQSDATNVYIGGDFTTVNGSVLKNKIAQINALSGIATGWNPNADGNVHSLALTGVNLYVGGAFNNIGGAARSKIAHISAVTGGASALNPSANGNVNALAVRNDTLFIGGAFTTIGGQARNRVAMYNLTSSTILASDVNANNDVNAIAVNGSKVYVGGSFTNVGSVTTGGLAEFDLTTNSVTSLNTSLIVSSTVNSLATSDSSVYLGGSFQYPNNGQAITNAATLKTLSNRLGYWMPQADDVIRAIYLSSNKVYLGGRFKTIQSRYQPHFASVDLYISSEQEPLVASLSTTTACENSSFTITGSNFVGVNSVKIGTTSLPFVVNSETLITVTPNSSVSGNIIVSNQLGSSTSVQAVTITSAPSAIITSASPTTFCEGQGGAFIEANTGAGLSYVWKNNGNIINGQTNSFLSISTAGVYSVSVTNSNSCSAVSNELTFITNPLPIISMVASSSTTFCDGNSVELVDNFASSLTYQWLRNGNPIVGETNPNYMANISGDYSLQVTNANCAIISDVISVNVLTLPTANISTTDPNSFCIGGSANLTANSGAGLNYQWIKDGVDLNAFLQTYNAVSSGVYSVRITDINLCSNISNTINVVSNSLPTVNAGSDFAICQGGQTTLSGSGATNYSWNNGVQNGVSFSPTATTTFTVTGTDANGCINTDDVIVTITSLPTVVAGSDFSICFGEETSLNATGAISYSWDIGINNGESFTPGATFTTTVTGTDANGCVNTDEITVIVNDLPVVFAGNDVSICLGEAVTLNGSGASSYLWSPAIQNGIAFNPTVTAFYGLTGTDVNGCQNFDDLLITVNSIPSVNAGSDFSICQGGQTTLSGSGATNYSWNNGVQNGVSFSPTATTTFTVTGTDVNGCINTDEILLTVFPIALISQGVLNEPTACSAMDANVTILGNASGTLVWSGSSTGSINGSLPLTIGNLGAGSYMISFLDGNFCTSNNLSLLISDPGVTTPTITASNNTTFCSGGTVDLISSESSGITWSNGETSSSISVSTSGVYSVTYNEGACSATSNFISVTVIPEPTTLLIGSNNPSVCSGNDGTIDVETSTNGTLSWTGTSSGSFSVVDATTSISGLSAGNYTIDFSDGSCTATTLNVQLSDPSTTNPIITADNNTTFCSGGSVNLTVTVADSYLWSTGETTQTITVSTTNDVSVTTIISGCSAASQPVSILVNDNPQIDAGVNQSICLNQMTTLTASGGVSYSWDNGIVDGVAFTPTTTMTYTVIGTDGNGCSDTDQVQVQVKNLPNVNAGSNQTKCMGQTATLNGTGPNGVWDNDIVNGVAFTPTSTTTYTFTSTGANGCSNSDQVLIIVNDLPTVSAGSDQTVCQDATVTLLGQGADSYSWDNGVSNNVAFVATNTTTYTVIGTDANGCTNTDQIVLSVNALPSVNAGADVVICIGETATLSGNGANNYTWNNGVQNGVSFNPTTSTTYIVTGTDANGCVNTDNVLVSVNPLPIVNLMDFDAVCDTLEPITLSGGTPNDGNYSGTSVTNNTFDPSIGVGTYNITYSFTDGNGCSNEDIASIEVIECISSVGLAENKNASFNIFPNPTTFVLFVELNSNSSNEMLTVYTVSGQKIQEIKIQGNEEQINVTNFSKGIYFLEIGNVRQKFVVE
jgi:hypothetical protein